MKKILVLLFVTSCASYENVRPGADGVHRVLIRGTDKSEVERAAIEEAKDFCKEQSKYPAFVEENTKYTGSMNENTHKTIQKVSKAAQVGGAIAGVSGGRNESNAGKTIFGLGSVGSVFQDEEAYTADMRFKCQ